MGRPTKWGVVVPSNRPEQLDQFCKAWSPVLGTRDTRLFIIRDQEPWTGIPDFIPRRTDMIRSWGFYLAWKAGCDYTLSLDDDTLPSIDNIFEAYEREFVRPRPLVGGLSVAALTDSHHEMRGFPWKHRNYPVGVQYGGWDGVLDFDAVTQIAHDPVDHVFKRAAIPVPKGAFVTTCAMNFAFRTDLTPIMWQLPLFAKRYNRFGDIWSGLLQKVTMDAVGEVMLVNGFARVIHRRASDPFVNLEREAPGLAVNERLWETLRSDGGTDLIDTYRDHSDVFADIIAQTDDLYAKHFIESRDEWLALFS